MSGNTGVNPVGSPAPPPGMRIPKPAGGDEDIGYRLEIAATTTFVAAALVVGLRFQARIKYAKLGIDDWCMGFAVVQALIATIIDFVATHHGLGRHFFYLTPDERSKQQYYSLLAQVFCIHALTFAKISISLTYVRILKGSWNPWLTWICHTISVSVLCVNTMVIIAFYAQCIPNKKAWDSTVPGTCYEKHFLLGFVLLQGSFSAVTDLALCVIPFYLLRDLLQIGRKSKAIILILMGLGLVTAIFAVIRTHESSAGLKPGFPDISYRSISGLYWAGMERNIAIMLGSIPQCRPLAVPIANFASRTFSKIGTKRSRSQSYPMDDRKRSDNTGSVPNSNMESFGKKSGVESTHAPNSSHGHSDSQDAMFERTFAALPSPSQENILPPNRGPHAV